MTPALGNVLSPMTPTKQRSQKTLGRRVVRWALTVVIVLVALFALAVVNNNYSLSRPSRAAFNAQLDHAIETSTAWIVAHPENYGNSPLMFMVGDMAEMSGDPRLRDYVQGYLASKYVRIPGRPITWYFAHWADPSVPVPMISEAGSLSLSWQERWFGYGSAPDRLQLTPEDRDNLFNPTKYSWGIRLHLQLIGLDMYRHFNGPSPTLDSVINPVAEGVARDAFWDFRVSDSYYQRSACLLGAGRPDLVRPRWIERILDHQNPDGTWNYCWYGWCRGILEFQLGKGDQGHTTVQGAWALYQLKYRYSDWINKNFQ